MIAINRPINLDPRVYLPKDAPQDLADILDRKQGRTTPTPEAKPPLEFYGSASGNSTSIGDTSNPSFSARRPSDAVAGLRLGIDLPHDMTVKAQLEVTPSTKRPHLTVSAENPSLGKLVLESPDGQRQDGQRLTYTTPGRHGWSANVTANRHGKGTAAVQHTSDLSTLKFGVGDGNASAALGVTQKLGKNTLTATATATTSYRGTNAHQPNVGTTAEINVPLGHGSWVVKGNLGQEGTTLGSEYRQAWGPAAVRVKAETTPHESNVMAEVHLDF